jgi:hypothetical protein
MNYTGIFDDLNYISYDKYYTQDEFKKFARRTYSGYTSQPIKLEFMDYVIKGMKRFLQSPFQQ